MKRLFSILFFLPLFSFCQNTKIYSQNPSILKYIKPSYKNILDLLTTNDGCKLLNKDSSLFTGKAYSIEYISDYYFLSSSPDSSVCRLKIIEFNYLFLNYLLVCLFIYFFRSVVYSLVYD